jgi:hypothetical protein
MSRLPVHLGLRCGSRWNVSNTAPTQPSGWSRFRDGATQTQRAGGLTWGHHNRLAVRQPRDRELWRFGSARANQNANVRAQGPVQGVGHLLADHNLDRLRDIPAGIGRLVVSR